VELARKQAEQENVNCSFIVGDLTDKKFKAYTEFEFAYDWEVLHHVFPDERNHAGLHQRSSLGNTAQHSFLPCCVLVL